MGQAVLFSHCSSDLQETHMSLLNHIVGVTALSLSTLTPYSSDHREQISKLISRYPTTD